MNTFTDYYALLGVDVSASTSDIKAAFKKLALQYHPDVYKGEDAQERMRDILRAYQTLSNPETRRQYDERRVEHHTYTSSTTSTSQATTTTHTTSRRPQSSSAARRDRERAYAFPDIRRGSAVDVHLLDMAYPLSFPEGQTLQNEGWLRGIAPENEKGDYHCHRCKHSWKPTPVRFVDEAHLPLFCPRCGARDWAEYLLLRCVHCCAVFESEQIRNQVGSVSYGNAARVKTEAALCPPYELFPLCPYCGIAHWCPAEESRVANLRDQLARKAAMMRLMWISIMVCAILALGAFVFIVH